MTQNEKILQYLRDVGSITPLEALEQFGCMRLAARIADLKEQGVKITKTTAKASNRYGDTVSFARYILEE